MNIPKIADAIGYIDNELITATLEACLLYTSIELD